MQKEERAEILSHINSEEANLADMATEGRRENLLSAMKSLNLYRHWPIENKTLLYDHFYESRFEIEETIIIAEQLREIANVLEKSAYAAKWWTGKE